MRLGDYRVMWRSAGVRLPLAFFREVHVYDIRHGTRTAELVPVEDFDVPPETRVGSVVYMASWTSTIRWTYHRLHAHFGGGFPDLTVVDIGCGKGKFLLVWGDELARDDLTQAVVGVDYSPSFVAAARGNLGRRGHETIEVRLADASELRAEDLGEDLVLYLYNPFSAGILANLLARLEGSIRAIAYCNPVQDDVVRQAGFHQLDNRDGWHPNQRVALYLPVGG